MMDDEPLEARVEIWQRSVFRQVLALVKYRSSNLISKKIFLSEPFLHPHSPFPSHLSSSVYNNTNLLFYLTPSYMFYIIAPALTSHGFEYKSFQSFFHFFLFPFSQSFQSPTLLCPSCLFCHPCLSIPPPIPAHPAIRVISLHIKQGRGPLHCHRTIPPIRPPESFCSCPQDLRQALHNPTIGTFITLLVLLRAMAPWQRPSGPNRPLIHYRRHTRCKQPLVIFHLHLI